MDQKYFRQPFALAGDVATIPEAVQPSGEVSFNQGWGADYQRDQTSDPLAKPVERDKMNWLLNAITNAVRQYQEFGHPEWIKAADNNGVAKAYSKGSVVRYSATTPGVAFETYVSLIDGNVSTPGAAPTEWQLFSYELASQAQVDAGANGRNIVTPVTLETKLTARVNESAPMVEASNVAAATAGGTKTLSFTAEQILAASSLLGRIYRRVSGAALNINTATTGIGGMLTGSPVNSGFIAIYAVYNPTSNLWGLIGINEGGAVAPKIPGSFPAGYTAGCLLAIWPTDASGNFKIGMWQDRTFYCETTTAVNSTMSAAIAIGTVLSLANIVPKSAKGALIAGLSNLSSGATPEMRMTVCSYFSGSVMIGATFQMRGSASAPFIAVPAENIPIYNYNQNLQYQATWNGTGVIAYQLNVVGYSI